MDWWFYIVTVDLLYLNIDQNVCGHFNVSVHQAQAGQNPLFIVTTAQAP